jgi:hypothetical protein
VDKALRVLCASVFKKIPAGRVVTLLELVLFIAVALWATWPLATQIATCIPLGSEPFATVPLFNLWTLWWNVDRIDHAYAGYWSAPIFYPADDAFAYSEPQLLAGQIAWLLWRLLPSPESIYNVILLGHLVLNGWSFCKLLRCWHIAWPVSLAGGLICEAMPLVHWQLGIVQLVPLWGIIWTIRFTYKFARQPSWTAGIGLGLSAACTYLLCSYYGLMLCILLFVTTPILVNRRLWQLKTVGLFAATMAVILVCVTPVAYFQWRTTQRQSILPPRDLVKQLSVGPQHYWQTPWPQLLPLSRTLPTVDSPWALSPGTLKLCFAALGCCYGLSRRHTRRVTFFLLAVALLGVVLAMGPLLEWHGWSIYDLLTHFPGYAQLRNIYRFAIFTQLMTIILTAFGLESLWRSLRNLQLRKLVRQRSALRSKLRSASWIRTIACAAVSAFLFFEVTPAAPALYCSRETNPPEWASWIRNHSRHDDVLAIFPFPVDDSLRAYEPTAQWMYLQQYHGRRMINGYSGFFPTPVIDREVRLQRFPDPNVWPELARIGVDLVIVHGQELNMQLQDRIKLVPTMVVIQQAAGDPAGRVCVYRVEGGK